MAPKKEASRNSSKRRQGSSSSGKSKVPTREDRLRASQQNRNGKKRGTRNGGIDVYGLLRILIPVICILLLIVLLRSCIAGGGTEDTTTTAPVESVTEPVTTAPPTTEAPTTEAVPLRYVVTGNNVNVRYADNQNRIYEQLSSGTEIGEIQEIEGSDYVRFQRDGLDLVIHKDYIAPIEN